MLERGDIFPSLSLTIKEIKFSEHWVQNVLQFAYHAPIDESDRTILAKPIAELVQDVQAQKIQPKKILQCYGKVALHAHEKTNCLTEVMLLEAEKWIAENGINLEGPLAGIPVSLKDSISVGGFDVSVGYSKNCNKPCKADGTLVKILKAAGTRAIRSIPAESVWPLIIN